jgi:hypothetical protein
MVSREAGIVRRSQRTRISVHPSALGIFRVIDFNRGETWFGAGSPLQAAMESRANPELLKLPNL